MKTQRVTDHQTLPENRVASSLVFSAGVFINAAIAGIASVNTKSIAKIISAFFNFLPP